MISIEDKIVLKELYERSIEKWEYLLEEAKKLDLDNYYKRRIFLDLRAGSPCAFCERKEREKNCPINPYICNCRAIHNKETRDNNSLYSLIVSVKNKKEIIKWIKWMIVALTKEWRRLKDK